MAREIPVDGYLISDDPARLDVDGIHEFLGRSYWAAGIPREVVERSVRHSLCFGLYAADGAQVGLVRIVTDYATFAWVADVYVLESHRRRGLSLAMLRFALADPRLQEVRRFMLATRDAHGLYTRFGFKSLAAPERFLENCRRPPWAKPIP